MKRFLIVENGVIANIIVGSDAFAKSIGALPAYEGAAIGEAYSPAAPAPAPETEGSAAIWAELDAAYQEGVNSAYDG